MESAPRKRRANDVISITPLGSGREVGRSAIVVKFKGKQVMLDCGVHPGKSGQDSLPFFDECDPAEIDLVLITHFHDDHCGALPYFTEKTNFKGKVFMTPPTRAVFKIFLTDHLRISGQQGMSQPLFDQKDLTACLSKIESIDFQQEKEYKGIRFCAYSAGHVLGAAMFMVEIANVRTLYSGDFSHEEDRHLMPAEVPPEKPDVFICESTYGTGEHPPRVERENIFTSNIRKVVSRGGRCLVPVFALGRAQELLLILDEYWRVNEELQNIPIYYTGATASRALRVYQTYINMMNENIKGRMSIGNPFQFQYVHNLNSLDDFEDDGPSVVIASPAMLQNGLSRQLFERWCSNSNNGVVLTGYVLDVLFLVFATLMHVRVVRVLWLCALLACMYWCV
jgi:cleavage and polyadenylation specificity factor subunit 3